MPNISKESISSGQGFKTTLIHIQAAIVAGNQNSNFTQLPIFFARGTNLSFSLFVRMLVCKLLFYFLLNLNAKYI